MSYKKTGWKNIIPCYTLDISEMSDSELDKTVFIQITSKNTLADVNRDLRYLEEQGYRYVFLDEVTLMDDFIQGVALFSDVFAACGMKIVLSGTDSLGFLFTEDEQLYDRCVLIHITFIPYREFEEVLGVKGIVEDINHRFTLEVLTRDFKSNDLAISARNLRKGRTNPTDILDRIDISYVTDNLRELLETKLANPKKEVFILQFPVGEFDMVIFDPDRASCEIYEIKHSKEIAASQYRHLTDEKKCADTQHRYGTITSKTVLYRGDSEMAGEIRYMNVEEYLKQLWTEDIE